ncbi:PAS domain-containing protein [Oceaniglobus trochenteri]|uniref:PAS domain-containing protein n=1 Tax=Oceaniglobus trochenteri TaxID=2763260 RepID=UPI001CFFAC74|nr:PAS domain-containing protein [Oceaniglobus trochenteri]
MDAFPEMATFAWHVASDSATYSRRALDLFGLDQAPDLDGFFDCLHPADRLRVEGEATSFLERGGSMSHEYRIVRPDGEVRHVFSHVTLNEQCQDGGPVVQGLMIDTTRERRLEAALSQSRAKTGILGFYEFDVASQTTQWSPELRRLLGCDTLRGKTRDRSATNARQLVHPEDAAMFQMAMDAALRRPGPYDLAFRILDKDGAVRFVRDRGEAHAPLDPDTGMVARATGTLTDMTYAEGPIEAHETAQDQFWSLIDTAPFGAYAVDADFRIVRMSKGGMAAFAGIDPLLGRDLSEVLHIMWPESFASEAVAHFRRTLSTGEPYRATPMVERRSDNRGVEAYDWGIDRVRLADGRFGVICHFYDLTSRVHYENELREKERRLSLAYEAADMGAWELDLASGATHWTPQLFRIFGVDDPTQDPNTLWQRAVHPDDAEAVERALAAAIEDDMPFDVDFRARMPDGETRYMVSKGELVRDDNGAPRVMIGVNYDVTTRKQAELAVHDSERRLRMIIDNTIAFVGVLTLDGILTEANQTALVAGDLERSQVLGKPFWETPWWSYDPQIAEGLRKAVERAACGEVVRHDAVVQMAEGRLITIDFMLAPIRDADGHIQMLVASGFDISEREEARTHVQSLMGEINHRTKNILTLVQIVARQTARNGAADFLERFEKRISALAAAQDLLVSSTSDHADLNDLAHAQLAHFEDMIGKRLHLSGPAVKLAPNAAQAIGMALHELATNAGKYGALSTGKGEVDLKWSLGRNDEGQRILRIDWQERGGPPVSAPERRGFGSTLIDQMARTSLDGDVTLDYAPAGLEWHFTCPVESLLLRR